MCMNWRNLNHGHIIAMCLQTKLLHLAISRNVYMILKQALYRTEDCIIDWKLLFNTSIGRTVLSGSMRKVNKPFIERENVHKEKISAQLIALFVFLQVCSLGLCSQHFDLFYNGFYIF